MSNELTLGVKLASKIQDALNRNKIPDLADLDWLASGDNIARIRRIRLGQAEIVTPEHVIDCDVAPSVPDGWSVQEHLPGGQFAWNREAQKQAFYFSYNQLAGRSVQGTKLRKELGDKPVLNASVLDYLLAHPHLIPDEWRSKAAFFWGTIYRDPDGKFYVRFLYWCVDRWDDDFVWLDDGWGGDNPALLYHT